MSLSPTASQFAENARRTLKNAQLQKALYSAREGFITKRAAAAARLPEFEILRDEARDIRAHTLAHLDLYLEAYEKKVVGSGGVIHYARTAEAANEIVLEICRRHGATRVSKGKTMVGEEIGLNAALEANGISPIETDLGEYIIQIRHETPSHIIAPAVHLTKDQIAADFRRAHANLPETRDLADPTALLAEARGVLREKFLAAEIGITGANFLVAETGTSIIVTNEGNGDLTQSLPKVHIVLASIEKLVPTLEDAGTLLRVLARSATGQDMSVYMTLSTGPRRSRRAGRISRHHSRQRTLGHPWLGFRRHSALNPLRRWPQSLSGLSIGWRPCLWLGLFRTDGRGDDRASSASTKRPICRTPRPSAAPAKASARSAFLCRK
jgi:L-lactate dehydrogenase complex protein LldF